MKTPSILILLLCSGVGGCATYQQAKNVKMVAFEDDVSVGRSVGPIRGESCQGYVMGHSWEEPPSLDKAMANARAEHQLRYVNNVSTEATGFDSFFYGKRCLAVRGTGYR